MSEKEFCSFCGKRSDFVNVLVAGPNIGCGKVCICDECVALAHEIIQDYFKKKSVNDSVRSD